MKANLILIAICLVMFLPFCVLTPCCYSDDGGYMQMLRYLIDSGKVDLMHWSQPTAIGLLFVALPIVKLIGVGFAQLDLVGVLFTVAAVTGMYCLLRSWLPQVHAFLVALSIFCFREVTFVAPTFMTDMPFLAYCTWWFYFTNRLISGAVPRIGDYCGWCLVLFFALLTRSTMLFALPALLTAALLCQPQRRQLLKLTAIFIACWLLSAVVTRFFSINSLSVLQTTALHEIIQLHDFARFNIRVAALAALSIIFSCSPMLIATASADKKLRPIQICCALVGGMGAIYFSHKGLFEPLNSMLSPLVIILICLASFNLPPVALGALRNNKVMAVIFGMFMVVSVFVLPIMAHPLVRHAIPGMVALMLLTAIANSWRTAADKIIFALSAFLIFSNIIALQQVRLTDFAVFKLAKGVEEQGVETKAIDAGWGWFCYEGLKPGGNDTAGYVETYKNWQKNANYFIGSPADSLHSARTLTRLELKKFPFSIETVVDRNKLGD